MDLPAPLGPDEPDPLASRHLEAEPGEGVAPTTGIGELDAVELHRRRQHRRRPLDNRIADQGPGVEELEDGPGRRLAIHARMQKITQLAQRPEGLDAHHQDDQQRLQTHGAGVHPPGAESERRGGAEGDAGIGDAALQLVGRQHPHGAAEQLVRLFRQQARAGLALTEGLESRQTLDRIQELRREISIGQLTATRAGPVQSLETQRREQGDEREGEQHRGDREVEKGDKDEDAERRQHADEDMGQVLAEIGLQLLDPVDHGEDDAAGALEGEVGGSQLDHLVIEALAEVELHQGGGAMGDHVAPIVENAAQKHDPGHPGEGHGQGLQGLAPGRPGPAASPTGPGGRRPPPPPAGRRPRRRRCAGARHWSGPIIVGRNTCPAPPPLIFTAMIILASSVAPDHPRRRWAAGAVRPETESAILTRELPRRGRGDHGAV